LEKREICLKTNVRHSHSHAYVVICLLVEKYFDLDLRIAPKEKYTRGCDWMCPQVPLRTSPLHAAGEQ
jgi:hypothetical protein